MKITILAVGKLKEAFYRDAAAELQKRLKRYVRLEIIEVADEKTPDHASPAENKKILDTEGARILKQIHTDAYVIALAIDGSMPDSIALSEKIRLFGVNGTGHVVFVIGGSLGLSDAVRNRADELLSFSKMTFPHQLMRVILLEQIYRSFRIIHHEPYHK